MHGRDAEKALLYEQLESLGSMSSFGIICEVRCLSLFIFYYISYLLNKYLIKMAGNCGNRQVASRWRTRSNGQEQIQPSAFSFPPVSLLLELMCFKSLFSPANVLVIGGGDSIDQETPFLVFSHIISELYELTGDAKSNEALHPPLINCLLFNFIHLFIYKFQNNNWYFWRRSESLSAFFEG